MISDKNSGYLISPKELSERWTVSRSSVSRIAERANLTRIMLGEGRNGTIRYIRDEVETFERARSFRT